MSYADADGVRIAYDDQGPRADVAILCLTGWWMARVTMARWRSLAARHRVITLDWRGHGDSGRVPTDFGHEELADDAMAVIEASGVPRIVPVTQAHGGWAAVELRRRLGPGGARSVGRAVHHHREHQAIGDVPPIRRLGLAEKRSFHVIDGEVQIEQVPEVRQKVVARRVDQAGRISILKHRCHVGRYLAGEQVAVESRDGLLHVTHNGVVIATHARRHLVDQDDKMDRRAAVSRPVRPTKGGEVLRRVDSSGSVSFAGCGYRVGNRHRGQTVGVRLVDDTVQITEDDRVLRTHRARHDRSKEFGALANPTGRPRRARDVA